MLPAALKQQFVEAIRRLLRPIVRQLITYGVSYPAFNRLVREVYVEVAEQHFALPFKRQTDSRVALVTGINRKEIAQVRERIAVVDRPLEVEDTAVTHVIGRWMAGPPYASRDGEPRRLPYEAAGARVASFARLVRELGIDVPVRSVLDELLRVGAVELLSDGDVVLRREVFIPPGGAEGKLTLLGSDPGELFTTIVHNIEAPRARRACSARWSTTTSAPTPCRPCTRPRASSAKTSSGKPTPCSPPTTGTVTRTPRAATARGSRSRRTTSRKT